MDPVIPPKSNRREKRDDRALYLVENGFLEFKQWRGVYAKRTATWPSANSGQ